MYLNVVKARLADIWYGMFGRGMQRSSLLPWLLVLVFVVPIVGYTLHTHGKFHTMKRQIKGEQATATAGPRPGGEEALKLTRSETPGNSLPEFLSATVLPGLGMDVLQISAFLPGRGEVELLAAPTVEQMANGSGGDRSGANDTHGAIELPWGGTLPGVLSPLGTTLSAYWKGRALELPVNGTAGRSVSEGGMLSDEATDASKEQTPDGGSASGMFRGTNFSDRWPSKNDVSVAVHLEARTLDLMVTAKNTGNEPEPMGIGWHPRFTVPSANREGAELKLPNGEVLQVTDRVRDLPTGKIVESAPALARMQGKAEAIGAGAVDESLVHLKAGATDMGPSAEFRDAASGFGLRMTALSTSIRELRVLSPAGSRYVALGMQTNLDDPLGRQWTDEEGGGIAILQPGQTLEWKVRLEIFPVGNRGAGGR